MDELNAMREQMDSLKENLNKSNIISRRLMVAVMKQKASWVNNYVSANFIIVPLMLIFLIRVCRSTGITMWVMAAFALLAVADTIVDLKTVRIQLGSLLRLPVLEMRRLLVEQKKARLRHVMIDIPLYMAWGAWFLYEVYEHMGAFQIPIIGINITSLSGVIITGLIALGACLGIIVWLFRKMQGVNDSIIKCAEETMCAENDKC